MKLSGKRILMSAAILLILFAMTAAAVYLKRVADYKTAVKETIVRDIDISTIPDGVYIGEYDVNFIYARVEVTVQDGAITAIELSEHKNGRGKPAEIVTDRIIAEQTIDVDTVSGATNSGIVIKKAVEHALAEGEASYSTY